MARALALAAGSFDVAEAALVRPTAVGLAVQGASGRAAEAMRDAAARLFEAMAERSAEGAADAGVLEEVVPGRGYVAAAPVLCASGGRLGALCLFDPDRRALLSGLQRRLFAAVGDLLGPALAAVRAPADALRALADAEPDAVAVFDADGRCLLRNARFDALLGTAPQGAGAAAPEIGAGTDDGAAWLRTRLMRDRPPVGVYRAALADGTWLSVEERRGPAGRSLVARVEPGAGPDVPDDALLFERCPFPMFVFHRDTREILAANAAALALYGWERDSFLRLNLDGVGPVPQRGGGDQDWIHRTRDGSPLAVSGRTVALDHGGRPAVLVTVVSDLPGAERPA